MPKEPVRTVDGICRAGAHLEPFLFCLISGDDQDDRKRQTNTNIKEKKQDISKFITSCPGVFSCPHMESVLVIGAGLAALCKSIGGSVPRRHVDLSLRSQQPLPWNCRCEKKWVTQHNHRDNI